MFIFIKKSCYLQSTPLRNSFSLKKGHNSLNLTHKEMVMYRTLFDSSSTIGIGDRIAHITLFTHLNFTTSEKSLIFRRHILYTHIQWKISLYTFTMENTYRFFRKCTKCEKKCPNFHNFRRKCANMVSFRGQFTQNSHTSFMICMGSPPTELSSQHHLAPCLEEQNAISTNRLIRELGTLIFSATSSSPNSRGQRPSFSGSVGRPAWVEKELACRIKVPHTFSLHSYTKPTICHYCKKLLKGLFRQGVQCKDCKYNAHKRCSERVAKDCTGEAPRKDGAGGDDSTSEDGVTEDGNDANDSQPDDESDNEDSPPATIDGRIDEELRDTPSSPSASNNIPLMRIVQSVKQTKRPSKVLKEGWMVHFTNKDSMRKRHYWRLDTKTITLYQNETGTKYYKEIHLSEILNIEVAKTPHPTDLSRGVMHCFEIRTANVDYFVGEEPVGRKDGPPTVNPPESGLGAYFARGWETDIRRGLMPVTPQSSATTAQQYQGMDKEEAICNDISQIYQIFADEVLGSGQFGIVYGGLFPTSGRHNSFNVKSRF
ncbi:unnamed protein product, partial [Meganyctiphanes norvegica]